MPKVPELTDEQVFGTPTEAVATAPAGAAQELTDADVFGPADDALRNRVRQSAVLGVGKTPETVLEAEAMASRYSLPPVVAGRNMDELRRRAEADDMAGLVDSSPKLAGWFADDAGAAVVAKPDVGGLSTLERIFADLGTQARQVGDLVGSLGQGIGQPIGQAVSGAGALLDVGARGIDRQVRGVFGDDVADLFWFDGPRYANPTNILNDLGEGVETVTSAAAPPEERQTLATDIASGVGQVASYAAVTAATGGTGTVLLGAGQGADIQADRAREAGTYGTGGADAALVGGAAITSVTERLGLQWLFRRLPQGLQTTLQRKVADILLAGAGEAAQEVTEGVAQDALTRALVDSEYEMFQGLDREALAAGGVGLLVRSALHLGRGRVDAERAKVERDQITEVGKVVDGLTLRESDPNRLREVLARLKGAGWQDVWVPVQAWQTLFQSPQEADVARQAAGVTDADYTAALLSGGPLRMPTEGFYTGLTPEQRKPLYEVARRSAGGMTPAEADAYDPEVALGEVMAEFGIEGRPAGDPSNQAYEQIRMELERAGASPDVAAAQAEQFAAFVRTQAARSGLPVDGTRASVVAAMDPRLQAVLRGRDADPMLDGLIQAVRSGRTFSEREVAGTRLVSALVRAGGINPDSFGAGDLRHMDAKYRPGLMNRAGMTLEDALTWARENGYIDQPLSNEGEVYNENAPGLSELLEMIAGDLSGVSPAFVRDDLNENRMAFNQGVESLRAELDAKGITDERLAEMTDAQVREALGFGREAGEGGEVFEQASRDALPSGAEIISILRSHPFVKLKGKPSRVFVAGSMASGKQRADSDIDVLIEVASGADELQQEYRRRAGDYFMKNNLTGVHDEVHPQWNGRRIDVYFVENAEAEADGRPMIDVTKGSPAVLNQSQQPAAPAVDLTPGAASRRMKVGDTAITYSVADGEAKVHLVRTPKESRGQGGARAAMGQFLAATDAAGLPVTLTVAEQDSTTDPDRLRSFYESLGFVAGEGDSMRRVAVTASTAPVGSRVDGGTIPGVGRVVWEIREIPLDRLILPEVAGDGTIPSAGKDADVARYADAMRRGDRFPNARGFAGDDGRVKLADGHRRALAAKAAGRSSIPVAVATYPDQAPATDQTQTAADGERDTSVNAPDGFVAPAIAPPRPGEQWFHGRPEDSPSGFADDRPAFFARDRVGAEWYAQDGGTVSEHSVKASSPARVRDLQDALVRLGYGTDPNADQRLQDAIAANSPYDGTNLADAIYIPEVRAELNRAGFDSLLLHDTIENDSTEALIVWDVGKIDAAATSATDQTQSPEFKAWFGESKVVDADGKPLVVYHGTSGAGFDVFKPGTQAHDAGIFFTDSRDVAGDIYGGALKGINVGAMRKAIDGMTDEQLEEKLAEMRNGRKTWWAPEWSDIHIEGDPAATRDELIGWVESVFDEDEGPNQKADVVLRSFGVKNTRLGKNGSRVIDAYLSIQNPLVIDADGDEFHAETQAGWLKQARDGGHDGLIVKNYVDGSYGMGLAVDDPAHTVYVAFRPEQIKSATGNRGTFDPNDPSILNQQARGSLTINPPRYPGGLRQFTITLGETRDFSTFLHESAHFYLEIMREIDGALRAADPATLTESQQRVLADHDALLKQLGVDSFDAITREQHEQFAETYEAYLREGKAPSPRLARAFQKFGAWLKLVYRTLLKLPNQRLNDETRAIFDRMLATDDEIDAARAGQNMGPMFATPEAAGMTPEEFGRYQEALRVARESAVLGEAAEQYRYELAERRRWQSEEMARIRAEVTPLVDASPGMQAKYLLRNGTQPDGSPLPEGQKPVKLNTAVVTDLYGKEWVKKNLAFMTAKDGAHPDLVASVLGFPNGQALVTTVANTPNRQDAIRAEAEVVWRERHPDPMTDGATVDRVQERVHNDAQTEVMVREINALNARAGREPGRPTVLAVMKQAAERIIAAQRVGSLNPNQYRTTEAKAGREALTAAAEGRWDDAVKARRRQLMAGLLYRAAVDGRERAEQVREQMVRLAKKPSQEKFARAGWESYLERVNDILHVYDVRRLTLRELQRRASMRAWVERQQEAGDVTAVSEELVARVEAQSVMNWRDATVAELDAAGEALTNIEHLARLKNKLVAAARQADKDEAVNEMVQRAVESLPDPINRPVSGADLSAGQQIGRKLAGIRDEFTRPENFIEALDGGESGPWHDFIWSAMNSAESTMIGLRKRLAGALKELRTSVPTDVLQGMGETVTVFGIPTTRASLIGAVLNTGNAGNLQRLKDGGVAFNDERLRLTDAQVAQMRGMLTAAELRYVQGLWTTVNSLWSDIVALQRRMSGLPPEKVEAHPFTVVSADGQTLELEGGYWPLAYDKTRSTVGDKQAAGDAMQHMMGQGFTRAATPKGYQKTRVAAVEAPLQLDFGAVMSRHLDQVMTDLAYREAVRDVTTLLGDQRVKDAVISRLGEPALESLNGMLSYSVSASSEVGRAAGRMQALADGVLSNMTVSTLAIRPDIALGNYVSAMIQGLDRAGLRGLLRGLWRAYTPGRERMTAEITRLSPFMAERLEDTDYRYRQELGRTRRERGLGAAYKRVVMTLHRAADHEVTRAIWWGRFQNELDRGATQAEAVRLADKTVRQTQTATARKDLSTFERDPAFRQSRQFMGPMFVIFGRMNAAARGQGATRSVGTRLSSTLTQVFIAPAVFALMAGRWPEDDLDDDDEIGPVEWGMWLAVNTLMFPLQTIPFVRDAGSAIEAAVTGNPINPRAAPLSAAATNMVKAGDSIWDNLEGYSEGEDVDWFELTRDLATLAAPLTAAPASQVRETTRAIEHFKDNPEAGATEMAEMAVYGAPPN